MLTKSITTKLAALCGAALITAAMSAPASAITIFSDDFNRANNNTVGMGWFEIEEDSNDVRVRGNELRLRDTTPMGSAEQQGLSSAGLTNISLSFDLRGINSDFFDFLVIEFDTGSGYTTLFDIPLVNTVTYDNFNFTGIGALANISSFDLRFRIDAIDSFPGDNADVETARLDNIVLSGDLAPIPEPGTLALFGLGLAGLGYARRRKVA